MRFLTTVLYASLATAIAIPQDPAPPPTPSPSPPATPEPATPEPATPEPATPEPPATQTPQSPSAATAPWTTPVITPGASTNGRGYFMTTIYDTIPGVTNEHVTIPAKTIELVLPTCIQSITPDANGYVPPGTCGAIWAYYPNFNAAVGFAALFMALTGLHIWQAVRTRKRFCWVIVMASTWETAAFTFRAVSAKNQQNVGIYLVFQIFVLLAPLWVNAFDYMVLGRMIHYFTPTRTLFDIPASTIAAVFVALDFVSFIVQLVGGSTAGPSSPPPDQLRAIHIYMGGIGLQEFFIVVFVLLVVRFQRDMNKAEKVGTAPLREKGWRAILVTLYVSLALISVRIIFRFVEFSQGDNVSNPILTNEVYFYALEAAPMFLAIVSFNIIHPGTVFLGPDSEMPGLWKTIKSLRQRRKEKNVAEMSEEEKSPLHHDMSYHHEMS